MRIGFLLPANFAVRSIFNGVYVQACHQLQALCDLGVDAQWLSFSEPRDPSEFDVIHVYLGGAGLHRIEHLVKPPTALVFSPIIDSNMSHRAYRFASMLGNLSPRFLTLQGIMLQQAQASQAVVVRSSHERDRIISAFRVDPQKIHTVLNGHTPVWADPALARDFIGFDEDFVLHISAYTQDRKNVIKLVEAVGPLNIPLVIAGRYDEGIVLQRLRELCNRYPNIHLFNQVQDELKNSLYAACRVFALPSTHEGTGLVALEAASLGARIVVTQHGGPPDYFLDRCHYVDPTSIESIRQAVEAEFHSSAENGLQQHVRENLTWNKSAQSLLKVYEKAIEKRHHRAG